MIWTIAILCVSLTVRGGSAPDATSSESSPIAIPALESHSRSPIKEDGFPDCQDEQEGEEEDPGDPRLLGAGLPYSPVIRHVTSRVGFWGANRWALGLGQVARMPFLRC